MRWRLCWCAWSLWRHFRAMRTFLIADPSRNLSLREVFLLIGSLTLPVFGLEPSLCWVAPFKRQAFLKTLSPSLSRKENTFLEVDQFLPCVPRGTQGKQQPQGPGRGRSERREEEDHLEQKTSRWRHTRRTYCARMENPQGCQIEPTAQAVPHKGWQQGATIAISPLHPEWSGAH